MMLVVPEAATVVRVIRPSTSGAVIEIWFSLISRFLYHFLVYYNSIKLPVMGENNYGFRELRPRAQRKSFQLLQQMKRHIVTFCTIAC